jgi:hypothetical protein
MTPESFVTTEEGCPGFLGASHAPLRCWTQRFGTGASAWQHGVSAAHGGFQLSELSAAVRVMGNREVDMGLGRCAA